MASIPLLQSVEEFLERDLQRERLSSNNTRKRKELLEKIKQVIKEEVDNDKLDEFLNQQRNRSRSSDVSRSNLPLPKIPTGSISTDRNSAEVYQDLYVDLNEGQIIPTSNLSPPVSLTSIGEGSGSGYESYASDEENSARVKHAKEEENIDSYFAGTNCVVSSFVYVENKTFLSGKKWMKRVGIIRENHFQCFKKVGDTNAILDLPLRAYTAYLSSKEGTNSMIINLESTGSDGTGYRFYVEHNKIDEWSRVIREKVSSVVESGSLPAPPVASRPTSSLPSSERPMIRQQSLLGVTAAPILAINDKPVAEGSQTSPTSPVQSSSLNYIGKGIKTAVTGLMKKDKTKKKIFVAEQMGAELCGSLGVCTEGKWSKKICIIKDNKLLVYGKEEAPELTLTLHGCDLLSSFDERMFSFKITKDGNELLFLEASSSAEMGRWVGMLIAETGCAEMPEDDNVYNEPDIYESVMSTARQVFHQTRRMKAEVKTGNNSTNRIEEEDDELYLDLAACTPATTNNPVSGKTKTATPMPEGRVFQSPKSQFVYPEEDRETENKVDPKPPARKNKVKKKQKQRTTSNSSEAINIQPDSSTVNTKGENDVKNRKDVKVGNERNKRKNPEKSNVASTKNSDLGVHEGREHIMKINIQHQPTENDLRKCNEEDELKKRQEDASNRLTALNVKKLELGKYIEAASSAKEKTKLDRMLRSTEIEYKKLEGEREEIQRQLNRIKDNPKFELNSSDNRRPATKPKSPPSKSITPSGNVMSRAKMFENLDASK